MNAHHSRVHGRRRHVGGQWKEATTWCSTVWGIIPLALLSVLLVSAAQLPRTIPRIAFLALAPGPSAGVRSEALAQGLRELGYVEGQNIILEYWWSAGDVDRLRANAAELVRLGVHVIVRP
jgi:putative ABC transport system substrate-binding protein